MSEVIGIGETLDEAKENAFRQLSVEADHVKYEVLQLPEKKILGIFGGKMAKVCAKSVDEVVSDDQSNPDKTSKAVYNFIDYVANHISDKEVIVKCKKDDMGAMYDLTGEGVEDVLGKYGEVLDSLQFLSGLVASQNHNSYYRVLLNVDGFEDRKHGLIKKEAAIAVTKFKKVHANVHLKPMNAYERRVVHELIQKLDGVESWSEGEGLNRHVIIGQKGARDYVERPGKKFRKNYNKRRKAYLN